MTSPASASDASTPARTTRRVITRSPGVRVAAMRVGRVVSTAGANLRYNVTLSIAVVVTVMISLTLLGAGLLIHQQVATTKDFWYGKIEVSVFLTPAITSAQRNGLHELLVSNPQIAEVFYENHAQAYAHFAHQFRDSPDLVSNVTPDQLPESFRIKLASHASSAVVAESVANHPGVLQVVDSRAGLAKFFSLLTSIQHAALLIAFLQVLAGGVLISNVIRVSAFTRREETQVMRLVGATDTYIRLPFVVEGAMCGAAGAAIASGLLCVMKASLVDAQLRPTFKFVAFISWTDVAGTVPVLFAVGIGVATLAAYVTLRRHLRDT